MLAHLLGRMPGWEAVEVSDASGFAQVQGPRLTYGERPLPGAFHVRPSGALEARVPRGEPPIGHIDGVPVLWPTDGADLPFDIFAAGFHLLARVEEYGAIGRDEHHRPLTDALHATRHGYLERPVVDEWLYLLIDRWKAKDPRLPAPDRTYAQTATMDVDNGAMFLGRPWWRSVGSAVRDALKGNHQRVPHRLEVIQGRKPDPYQVHQRFIEVARANGARVIVNFMATVRHRYDHAIAIDGPVMRQCVHRVAEQAEVGLHPGYRSSELPEQISEQKQRLEAVLGRPVTSSRQHFLRLQLPDTLLHLHAAGIQEEHSMGVPDRIGFRAGTCTPFPFYDLVADRPTTLMIHPFAAMDSALAYGMGLAPGQAGERIKRLADRVRKVEGRLITVWHERFLSDYGDEAGWGGLIDDVLSHTRP